MAVIARDALWSTAEPEGAAGWGLETIRRSYSGVVVVSVPVTARVPCWEEHVSWCTGEEEGVGGPDSPAEGRDRMTSCF